MKMLKILGKAVKLYTVIDTVVAAVVFTDHYLNTKGWKIDHDKAKYYFNPVTKNWLKNFDRKLHKFGLIIDDTKDEEDHLDILDVEQANTTEA